MVSVGFRLSPLMVITGEPRFTAGVQAPGVKPLPEAQEESGKHLQGCERKQSTAAPRNAWSRGELSRGDVSAAPSSLMWHLHP